MQSEYTEGEWEVEKGGNDYTWRIFKKDGNILALLEGYGCTKKEVKANAHLIFGAPDLLKACSLLVAFCESKERLSDDGACPTEAYEAAKVGLAKAHKQSVKPL